MWRGFDEFKFTAEDWVNNTYEDPYRKAHYMYIVNRALRKAARDKIITRGEQKSLWSMINSSKEDAYVAFKALETKYNNKKSEIEYGKNKNS